MKSAALALAAVLLAGCGDPAPKVGIVASKEHDDAYTYPQTYCAVYSSNIKQPGCAVYGTRFTYVPEVNRLHIEASDGKTGWYDVTPQQYAAYKQGDDFNADHIEATR